MDKFLFFLTGVIAALAGFVFLKKRSPAGDEELLKKREELRNELKNTPAPDLVDNAANSDELRSNATGIADKFRKSLRDKAGTILSGIHGNSIDGSGGSGN